MGAANLTAMKTDDLNRYADWCERFARLAQNKNRRLADRVMDAARIARAMNGDGEDSFYRGSLS